MSLPKLEGRRLSTLRFDIEAVKKLYEHARQCKRHRLSLAGRYRLYGEDAFDGSAENDTHSDRDAPAVLHLAKDQGIYLVSSGLPLLKDDQGEPVVCYAIGYDPNVNEHFYDDAVRAVGGDDFVEDIDIETLEGIFGDAPNASHLIVEFYEDKYAIGSYTPPPAPAPKAPAGPAPE